MNLILAQAAQSQQAGLLNMGITIAFFVFVFYFFIIRPQSKKAKEHEKMLSELNVNDKILTSSGMIGIITKIKPEKNTMIVRVDDENGTRIEFQRSAIVGKLTND